MITVGATVTSPDLFSRSGRVLATNGDLVLVHWVTGVADDGSAESWEPADQITVWPEPPF